MLVLLVRVHYGIEEVPRASVLRAVSDAAVCFYDVAESLDNAQQFADVRVMLLPDEGPEQRIFGSDPVMQTLATFSVQPTLVLRVQMMRHQGNAGGGVGAAKLVEQQTSNHLLFSAYYDELLQGNNKRRTPGLPLYNQIQSPAMSAYPVIPPQLLQYSTEVHICSPFFSASLASSSLSSLSSSSGAGVGAFAKAASTEERDDGEDVNPRAVTVPAVFASLSASLFKGPTDNVQLNKVVFLIQSKQEQGVQEQEVPRVFAESFGEKCELKRLRASIEKNVAEHVQISTHDGIAWYFSTAVSSELIQERFQLLPKRSKSKKARLNATQTPGPDADFNTIAAASSSAATGSEDVLK